MATDLGHVLRVEMELCFLFSLIGCLLRACRGDSEVPGRTSDPGALGEWNALNLG